MLLEGKQWVGHLATVVYREAAPRPHENGEKMRRTVTASSSTQIQEESIVIIYLIVVELRTGRTRRHADLCDYENSLELEQNGWIPREITNADFAVNISLEWSGLFWLFLMYVCNNDVSAARFGDGMASSYWLRARWFVVMATKGQRLLVCLLLLMGQCLIQCVNVEEGMTVIRQVNMMKG